MTTPRSAVAITGMAGRFPGAPTLDAFWRNLCAGIESLETFTAEDILAAGVPPAVSALDRFVPAGTVLENTDLFDAGFFGFSPREAEVIDPQHRLFLECAWEALENAGYPPQHAPGSVGVFAGCSMNTYYPSILARNQDVMAAAGGYQLMLGNDKDFLTTRVSYKLNLRGPSMVIQTACSTSLVAIQAAYQSLIKQQCDMALAGGSSITFPQKSGYLYQEGMIFSPDGKCRPFDAAGQGIRTGSGVGIVVLKRLEDALADGDTIRAIIRGAAINNDGSIKVGYTAPSVEGQAEVIAMAQALARVDPDSISYVETHGTGTPLGDPIEIAALTQVFRAKSQRQRYCAIGSVKSNIGHLDATAGVAGLLKTVLSLEHKAIPPSLNFETPNPAIDFATGPFFVNTALREWPAEGGPRRAGVSSFGIGGTNAHVVLEEAPEVDPTAPATGTHLLVLSAKTRPALEAATNQLKEYLEGHPDTNIADVAYTLQLGREAFGHRRVIGCLDSGDAVQAINTKDPERFLTGDGTKPRPTVFMFSGQGSQYPNMGRQLYENDPVFRQHFDECAALFRPLLGLELREVVYPAENSDPVHDRLNQTDLTQPALFSVEYSLAKMWIGRGVVPEAMIGHSIGEYPAACIAGVFSLADAIAVVAERGRLMQSMPPGTMLSVPLPENEVRELLGSDLSLAAVNAPGMSTISGPATAVTNFAAELATRGLECRPLHTSHAFHSAMMEPMLAPFEERVRQVTLNAPQIPFVSNLTGTWITKEQAVDPGYWTAHLRREVRFAEGLALLSGEKERVFLEIGPGNALGTFARQTLGAAARGVGVLASLPHARQSTVAADDFAHTTFGRLWLLGATVDWASLHRDVRRRRIPLPTYPFERQRYWVEPSAPLAAAGGVSPLVKRPEITEWFYAPCWFRSASLEGISPAAELPGGSWLIFADSAGIGKALANRVRTLGGTVTMVEMGNGFREAGPDQLVIDPADPDHYRQLLASLKASQRSPSWLVHLWGCGRRDESADPVAVADHAQTRGFYSLMHLAKAVGQDPFADPTHWTVVVNGTQAVLDPAEVTCPERATVHGPCQVIPLEYHDVTCRSVDVELPGSAADAEALAEKLVKEATFTKRASPIAYRARRRWELAYDAAPLPRPSTPSIPARDGGVYLITGGTGGLGLVFARSLARPNTTLLLVSRSGLPPREEWDALLELPAPAPRLVEVAREVKALEQSGARVEVIKADVGDVEAVSKLVAESLARWGTIHGVIHAAGVPAGGILQLKTPEAAAAVLDAKVRGTIALRSALEGIDLDFFVLCSSINSVMTLAGGSDYCSANAFLDAYAHARQGQGDRAVVSINWDTWRETGMAVNAIVPPELEPAKAESLATGILAAEGLEALDRILAARLPQTVVSTKELNLLLYIQRLIREASLGQGRDLAAGDSTSGASRHARPDLSTAFEAPRNDDEKRIAAIWGALLGIEEVGIHDNFFELGGHSLLATQVLVRLRDSVGVSLPLETIFDAPTVAQMTERVTTLRWIAESAKRAEAPQENREEFEL